MVTSSESREAPLAEPPEVHAVTPSHNYASTDDRELHDSYLCKRAAAESQAFADVIQDAAPPARAPREEGEVVPMDDTGDEVAVSVSALGDADTLAESSSTGSAEEEHAVAAVVQSEPDLVDSLRAIAREARDTVG